MVIEDTFLRLEIFKSLIASNVTIDDQFFPFLQQSLDWIKEGKQPEIENTKTAFINGVAGAMA